MCKNPLLLKRFLKTLFEKFTGLQVLIEASGCSSVNLYCQDESRFGLLTVMRRMITARGVKPVAPYLHRFDNLYLFGAFSPISGDYFLLEMPHCNSDTFQVFLNKFSEERPAEFKVIILDNGAFHHAVSLIILKNIALIFLPCYSPELNPAERMWRHFKDKVSMVAYNSLELLQQKISEITNNINNTIVHSICSNEFYQTTFKTAFN